MWNMVENGDVGMWWITFDVECSRERLCGMWRRTLTWNVLDDFDVECGGERWCEIWWITLTWNAPENGYVKYGGER